MADVNKTEESAKKLEIEMLRKMGIDVVLDKDEFNRVLKANEQLQKMELELSELSKLKNELNSLNEEKKTVDENNQRLKEDSIERGKKNFAEFIEAAKALKEFIPATKVIQSYTNWYDINTIRVQVDNSAPDIASSYDITEGKFIYLSKRNDDNSIVCTIKNNTNEAIVYYDENSNQIDENIKPWYLYENFANSNHISELKTAIKEDLEKRIGTTKEKLDKAHNELHEAEKAVKDTNLLSENQNTEPAEPKKIDNSVSITTDEFFELSRSIDSKSFEKFADKIQAGSAEYWTYLACIQIEEYNTKQLKWILENREVRFDEIKRNDALNEKVIEEANTVMNLPQWAAVSDDPAIIDAVFSKMTENDFTWAKESGVFKKAEEFYNEKFVENPEERNSSVSFDSLKNWVKQYSPESFSENKPVHYYARQVPPEEQDYDIDEELTELEVSIIETYTGSKYSEIINNDIPNGSMSQFADTMNEISDDFDTFFQNGGKPIEQDLEDGRAQYASLEEAVNTELPKKDGSKYTEEEMKEWRNVFERYSKASDMGSYWSSTNATHEVLTQVMELQTGEPFVLASLKGSSQGEDVTAVIPEKLYTKEFVEDIEAKYWNEGVEYLVFEDDSGKIRNLEDLQEHDVFENDSISFYLPSYKSAERLAVALGAKKGELTVYDFEGYEKTPKYEKVQYMKVLTNPLDDLRTVLKAYYSGFDSEYKLDNYDEDRVTKGKWSIATGGYDQAWELYYENIPVASCDTDKILEGYGKDFNGFTEADMLRVVTQEYRNIKCPEILPLTVDDYEQYLNDYFHDGSFTLEPENAFDEYPFEGFLYKNLERHYHYERDSVGGVILSYDDSNHTEYLQPGDDANTFLSEVEKIENSVIQVNAEEQLDNLINNYFPDFFPEYFRSEDTKTFITQQEIIEAVNNFECGKLYREIDPEGFAKDAQEWIEKDSPAFTNVSELPKSENQISNGQVLGFVKDNKIYINIDSFNAETPIHEYTHLWDKAVQKKNPELWKQGVELLKKTDTWKEIEHNPAYADIAGDEDLLASEVHARLAGKEGAELFRNISEEVRKNVGTVLYDLRKELAEEFCSDKINDVQPFRDDLKRIHDTNFAGINFEVSAKEWTPIRIQQQCEEICDKLGLEYMDVTSNYPREDGTVLSNDTYFVNLSVSGFKNLPLQHVISSDEIKSDEIKLAAYKWNEGSWNYIRDNFTEWKEGNLQSVKELSVNDFVNITLKDFVDGKNPIPHITENVGQENIQMQYERKTHNEYTLMSKEYEATVNDFNKLNQEAVESRFSDTIKNVENINKVYDRNLDFIEQNISFKYSNPKYNEIDEIEKWKNGELYIPVADKNGNYTNDMEANTLEEYNLYANKNFKSYSEVVEYQAGLKAKLLDSAIEHCITEYLKREYVETSPNPDTVKFEITVDNQSYPIDEDGLKYITNKSEWGSVEDRLNEIIDKRFEEEIEQKENDLVSDVLEYIAQETNGNLVLKNNEVSDVLFSDELVQIYAPKREFLEIQPEETKAALIEAGIATEDLYSNVEAMTVSEEARDEMLSASFAGQGGLTQKAFADNGIEIDLETAKALENCFSQIEAITKYTSDGHDLFNIGNGVDTISEHSIEYSEETKSWFIHEKNWIALSAIKGDKAGPDDYMEKAGRVGDRNWSIGCELLVKYVYQEIKEDGEMEKEFPDTFKMLKNLKDYTESLTEAKQLISDFCFDEYMSTPTFDDLKDVGLAYTTFDDPYTHEEHEIQTSADLVNCKIITKVNNKIADVTEFEDLKDMVINSLNNLDFNSLIYIPTSKVDELLKEEREDYEKHLLERADQIISETFDKPSLAKRAKLYVPSDYGYEEDNKIHILIEFDNEAEREDDLFNALAERHLILENGKEVDFNPIKPEKSGTIEQYLESLERIKENRYQRRKEDNLANVIVTTDNFREVFNEVSKLPKFKDKPLEAAGWCIARVPKEKREEVGKWLSNLNGPKKKDINNLFIKWNKENNLKPATNKSITNEKDDWSISD